MTNSPGAIQAGGDVTITKIPEPKLSHGLVGANKAQPDGLFATTFWLNIDSQVSVGNLLVGVECASVVEVTAWHKRGGTIMLGPTGVVDGYGGYVNIPDARGEYEVFARHREPETCKLLYRQTQ